MRSRPRTMIGRYSTTPYTPIVVNTGGKLVVIDTGTGEANFAASKGAAGQFLNNLDGGRD